MKPSFRENFNGDPSKILLKTLTHVDAGVAAWRDYRIADTEIFCAVVVCEPS